MGKRPIRYKEFQRFMTGGLIADAATFLLYLLFAGLGVVILKIIFAIFLIALSSAFLALLYLNKELLRPRSLWMTAASGALLLCTLMSLLLRFP